jgi:hypothetical protein
VNVVLIEQKKFVRVLHKAGGQLPVVAEAINMESIRYLVQRQAID